MSQLVSIGVDSIRESKLNPRKSFDQTKIDELSESIKVHGLLQPIVVRPLKKSGNGNSHEIVCGARRYRAARLAGLKEVPVIVRPMEDAEAFECMVIENLQRADIDPLDEADGFKALQERGLALADIGAKVGKSERFVFTRLRLCTLSRTGRKMLQEDRLPIQHAYQIAQLEPKDQDDLLGRYGMYGGPRSLQDLASIIGREFTMQIKDAGFDTKLDNLVKNVGPCAKCPKNTSFNPNLFAGTPDDGKGLCTDRSCWNAKSRAAGEERIKKILAEQPDILQVSREYNHVPKGVLSRSRWEEAWMKGQESKPGLIVHSDRPAELGTFVKVAIRESNSSKAKEDPDKLAKRKAELRSLRVENVARGKVFDACLAAIAEKKLTGPLLHGPLAPVVLAKLLQHVTHSANGIAKVPGPSAQEFRSKLTGGQFHSHRAERPTLKDVNKHVPLDQGEFETWLLSVVCSDEVAVSDYHRPSGFALFAAAETLGVDVEAIRAEADYQLMTKKQKAEHDKASGGKA